MNPSIAVVIPVRNGMPYLAESLASVKAQSYDPLEIVVVDDGSTDGTQQWVSAFRELPLRLIEQDARGPAAARNAGVRATTSEYVAFLDADDLWEAGALHSMTAALAADPEAAFAQGLIRNFRETAAGEKQFFTAPYRYLNLGANVWRRDLFETVGLLDEDLRLCEDLEFLMRCWERDVCKARVEQAVLQYRRHPGNMTHGLSGAGFGTVGAYKKRIERIRRGEFDPSMPRRELMQTFLGTGPADQDASYP